jgi:hypothetical protein
MKYIDIKTIEGKCGGVGSWLDNVLSSPAPGDTLYYKTPHHHHGHHGHHGQKGGNSSRLTKRRKYKTKSKSKSKSKSKTKRYIRRNCKY